MRNTKIEYLDKTWNFYTGCWNWQNGVCPVGEKCWAKSIDKRFGRSFEPMLHPEKLLEPLKIKYPQYSGRFSSDVKAKLQQQNKKRIGVCFTGDLFGDWVNPDIINQNLPINSPITGCRTLSEWVKTVIGMCPQYQFFFLTKCPQNYQKWGEFPDNAWLGATVNYAAPMGMALTYFAETDAKHKWLSIEPLMGEIKIGNLRGVDWVVIGGWSQGNIQPKPDWIGQIVSACDKSKTPVFLKDNLIPMIDELPDNCFTKTLSGDMNLRQEFPNATL